MAVIALGGQRENSVFNNRGELVKVLCLTPSPSGRHELLYQAQRKPSVGTFEVLH